MKSKIINVWRGRKVGGRKRRDRDRDARKRRDRNRRQADRPINLLAKPKSVILICPVMSTRMFSGFKSLEREREQTRIPFII